MALSRFKSTQNLQFARPFCAKSLPENVPFINNQWFCLKTRFKLLDYFAVFDVRHFLGQAQIL